MRLKHKFISIDGFSIDQEEQLLIMDDVCLNCNIKFSYDFQIERKSVKIFYEILNNNYPCLTEEEYMIKKLIE